MTCKYLYIQNVNRCIKSKWLHTLSNFQKSAFIFTHLLSKKYTSASANLTHHVNENKERSNKGATTPSAGKNCMLSQNLGEY